VEFTPITRRVSVILGMSLLSASLLASLIFMSAAIQNSGNFGAMYSVLLVTNTLGLLAFVAIIVFNLRRLFLQLRRSEPGAKLTLRMLVIFVALSIIPLLVLYGFSLDFLRRGIDSWFDVKIDQALNDSLELSRVALDLRMRELLAQTEHMAVELGQGPRDSGPINFDVLRNPDSVTISNRLPTANLDTLRERSGAEELLLLSREGRLLRTSSGIHANAILPSLPNKSILLHLAQSRSYIGLDPSTDSGLYIRIAVNVPDVVVTSERRILHALYPVASKMGRLADSVEAAFVQYNELDYLREQLKLSFAMTLTLVLLFSIVTAVWAAIYSARRLAQPIRDLAAGTASVAAGNYAMSLPVQSNDDMGFLVRSFNDMTKRVAIAQAAVNDQHEYLNSILSQLSAGVIALNSNHKITTMNNSAAAILDLESLETSNKTLSEVAALKESLVPFADGLHPYLEQETTKWEQEIAIFRSSGRRLLMCRGTRMPLASEDKFGHVIVFDDITALIQGQRDTAWSEVARRLAHEIKNPLTPIQLSAERLRRKYAKKLDGEDLHTLERLTDTIIQQVDTMKLMVNTFSDYARPPKINPEPTDLNALIEAVVELFKSAHHDIQFELDLSDDVPEISIDAARFRQVINNLVKNAIEASNQTERRACKVSTKCERINNLDEHLEIRIEDSGTGIPDDLFENIFEPYVTNKTRGTGLGLAIAKKIVEEHHGEISLANLPSGGAAAIIRLPLEDRNDTLERNITRKVG
jgi:nitrogen fixation/metabolism regulation signal transduction histidine kinase